MIQRPNLTPLLAVLCIVFPVSFVPPVAAQVAPVDFALREPGSGSHEHGASAFRMLVETFAGIEELQKAGKLPVLSEASVQSTQFQLPVVDTDRLLPSYFTGNYVDLDPRQSNDPFGPGALKLDFLCGGTTYDGHNGVDLAAWPFSWSRIDDDSFVAVAAADGTIVAKSDGAFDEHCAIENAQSNYVAVRHPDGKTTFYHHLKKGSVTAKSKGDTVARGEVLGTVASSGRSTGPHLHFHIVDRNGRFLDPYRGPCSTETGPDLWADRTPYPEPRITSVSTYSDFPEAAACPARQNQNAQRVFAPGERVFVGAYLADVPADAPIAWRVYRPNGQLYGVFDFVNDSERLVVGYFAAFNLPFGSASNGAWRYGVDFAETTRQGQFQVGSGCRSGATVQCLNRGRFRLEVFYKDFQGKSGIGNLRKLTDDTAVVWFFDPGNVEIAIKVLDATGVNGKFWVFFGALSDVRYVVRLTDVRTGAVQEYLNPERVFASVGDTQAFDGSGARAEPQDDEESALEELNRAEQAAFDLPGALSVSASSCTPSANVLCLNGNRFRATIDWKDFGGNTGQGRPRTITGDTGYFWFFDANNVEVVLKVLEARGVNGKFWVFFGSLTNVEFELTVEDTQTGARRVYRNQLGDFASAGDTGAFDG
ncbi:MAG: M23 family metallopeptidase [Acidobacteriota bacterium]